MCEIFIVSGAKGKHKVLQNVQYFYQHTCNKSTYLVKETP